jgi:hypothetical protein
VKRASAGAQDAAANKIKTNLLQGPTNWRVSIHHIKVSPALCSAPMEPDPGQVFSPGTLFRPSLQESNPRPGYKELTTLPTGQLHAVLASRTHSRLPRPPKKTSSEAYLIGLVWL